MNAAMKVALKGQRIQQMKRQSDTKAPFIHITINTSSMSL